MSDYREFFEAIAKHLLAQGQRCATTSGKLKTTYLGKKDPLGFVVSKRQRHRSMDEKGVYTVGLPGKMGWNSEQVSILEDLQAVHDVVVPSKWEIAIEIMRKKRYG